MITKAPVGTLESAFEVALDNALIAVTRQREGTTYALHPSFARDMPSLAVFLARVVRQHKDPTRDELRDALGTLLSTMETPRSRVASDAWDAARAAHAKASA